MYLSGNYREEKISLGRRFAFIGAYAIAATVLGMVSVVLLLILLRGETPEQLQWLGLIGIPGAFLLYLWGAYRIFRLFGRMFHSGRPGPTDGPIPGKRR